MEIGDLGDPKDISGKQLVARIFHICFCMRTDSLGIFSKEINIANQNLDNLGVLPILKGGESKVLKVVGMHL